MKSILILCLTFGASAVFAEVAPSDADKAALVVALEKRGCLVTDYNDPAILDESHLDADVANAVIAQMVDSGEVSFVADGMELHTPGCAAAADASATADPTVSPERAKIVALIEAHDCKLVFGDAEKVLTEAGFTPETANPIMEAMVAEGELEVGPNELILKSGNCQ